MASKADQDFSPSSREVPCRRKVKDLEVWLRLLQLIILDNIRQLVEYVLLDLAL